MPPDPVESGVRWYSRAWPTEFTSASGSTVLSVDGNEYLDFFAGAGSLNYGHNDPVFVKALVDYLTSGGITLSLDMDTVARREFMRSLQTTVLTPRRLDYRLQFTGPSGSDAVEAAIRLAQIATSRTAIACLSGSFHGMTLAARMASDLLQPLRPVMDRQGDIVVIPHELDAAASIDDWLEPFLRHANRLAAIIVECVQGEAGARPLSAQYLQRLQEVCLHQGCLLIVDEVQTGCGRTGPFFSFERHGITPSIICLSKSLSGLGLPMAMILIDPSLDVWGAGEHSGTFRGNNLAFVTGTACLHDRWTDGQLEGDVARKGRILMAALEDLARRFDFLTGATGEGLLQCLHFRHPQLAALASQIAFEGRLLVETGGRSRSGLKLTPALTIADDDLYRGIGLLSQALFEVATRV